METSALTVAAIGLIGVGVGAFVTFGGVVYAERQRDKREREARERGQLRGSLRELRDATLTYEDATTDLLIERMAAWNAQPKGQRVWKPAVPTSSASWRWAVSAQVLTALCAELEDRALADQIEAYQTKTAEVVNGPSSPAKDDFDAQGLEHDARADLSTEVARAIGAAIRQAPA